jgi:WD40 repeat protein
MGDERAMVANALAEASASSATPPEKLLAMADVAAREGRDVDARRLRDRAMNRLEVRAGQRLQFTPRIGETASTRGFGGGGRWAVAEPLLVEVATGRVVRAHDGAIEISPNGRYIATSSPTMLTIADLESGADIASVAGATARLAFDPTSQHLLAWLEAPNASFEIVRIDTSGRVERVGVSDFSQDQVRFDARGRHAVWPTPKGFAVYDFDRGTVKESPRGYEYIGLADTLQVDLAGKFLVANDAATHVRVTDIDTGREVFRAPASTWALSGDGTRLAWSPPFVKGRQELRIRNLLTGRDEPVSPRLLGDRTAGVWDGRCGGWEWRRFEGQRLDGFHLCTAPEGITLDLAGGTALPPDARHARARERAALCVRIGGRKCGDEWSPPTELEMQSDLRLLVMPGHMALVDMRNGEERVRFAESEFVRTVEATVSLSPDGASAVGTDVHGRTRVWDARTGAVRWRGAVRPEVTALAMFTATNDDLVTASEGGTIRRWNAATGDLLSTWNAPCTPVALASRARGQIEIACRDEDSRNVEVYEEGRAVAVAKGLSAAEVALDPAGESFAVFDDEAREVRVVPLIPSRAARTFSTARSFDVHVSVMRSRLVVQRGATAHVYDLTTGLERARIENAGRSLLSDDGSILGGAATDGLRVALLDDAVSVFFLPGPDRYRLPPLLVDKEVVVVPGQSGEDAKVFDYRRASTSRSLERKGNLVGALAAGRAPLRRVARVTDDRMLVLTTLDRSSSSRMLVALPGEPTAVALADDALPRVTGDAARVSELAQCTIGTATYPLVVCEGRF